MSDEKELQGIDAHISAALDASEAPAETVAIEAPEAEPAATAAPKGDRGRDEKGRFAPKSEPATAPEQAADLAPVESTDAQPEEPKPDAPKAFSDGHFKGWSPDQRAKFETLPPEAQSFAVDLATSIEGRFTSKLMEAADFRKTVEPALQVLNAERDLFSSQGMTPIQGFQAYANIEKTLTYGTYAEKVGLVQEICQRYGVPFAEPQAADPFDPLAPGGDGYAAIHDQRAILAREQAERARLQAQLNELQQAQYSSQVTSFASATNADGTPKYPHFDAVRPAMAQLLNSGKAASLEDAYALASKPISDYLAAQTARARQEAEAQQRRAIEKARKAAPVKASPSAPNGKASQKGIDAILGSVLDQAGF